MDNLTELIVYTMFSISNIVFDIKITGEQASETIRNIKETDILSDED